MKRLLALAAAVALLALPASANDWPNARHDPQRTGHSGGHTALGTPTLRWRQYMGGAVSAGQMLFADVDGDGVTDVVYAAAGKVYAKHTDDTILWETGIFGAQSVLGPSDLDGDGNPEIVVLAASGGVRVIAGATGLTLWELPLALRGLVSSARTADLDGDGRSDLYVGQCLNAVSPAMAYSFAAGFAAPRQLWQLPQTPTSTCGTSRDVIGDVDGDGSPEVVQVGNATAMPVINGATGMVKGSIAAPPSGQWTPYTAVWLRNLDADPALELVTETNGYVNGEPPVGARRVAVFDYGITPSPGWHLVWEDNAPDLATGNVDLEPDAIADLDGDGQLEIAYALYDGIGATWTTTVRRAATGVLVAQSSNAALMGAAVLDASAHPMLLTQDPAGVLHALALTDSGLVERWSVPSIAPVRYDNLYEELAAPNALHTMVLHYGTSPAIELVGAPFDPTIPPEDRVTTSLVALDPSTGTTPQNVGTFLTTTGVTVIATLTGSGLSRPYPQPVVITSDGYLVALDRAMSPTNRIVTEEFTIPGMRVGGYYSGTDFLGPTPVIGSLGGQRSIVVRDSRPMLMRLNATGASFASPPQVLWSRQGAGYPLLADVNGDGTTDVAAIEGRDVVALDAADGTHALWTATAAGGPPGSSISGDLLPAVHPGSPGVDVVLASIDSGARYIPVSLRGADGTVRWNSFARPYHSGFETYAVHDLTGDGVDDIATAVDTVLVIDGTTGMPVHDADGLPYAAPVIAPFTQGAAPEVWLTCSYAADLLFSQDLLTVRTGARPSYPYGAVVSCNGQPAFVAGTRSVSDLWTVSPDALPPAGPPGASFQLAHAVLAGGMAYPDGTPVPSGVDTGTLSNVTSVDDLDGLGHPAVLVGGSDGWLYALDPCSLTLRWSLPFRVPVGEPVVGDTDGDGIDDVLVMAADGYLYQLGTEGYPAPAYVYDTDPPAGITNSEVSQIETFNTLYATWAAVPGATSYEVGVFTTAGTALQFPEYQSVTDTSITVTGLPLTLGGSYRFAVIAVGPAGTSPEADSSGVTVVDTAAPTVILDAMPPAIAPSAHELTTLTATMSDGTGLAHAHADIRGMDGTVIVVVDDEAFSPPQPARTLRYVWNGADNADNPLPLGVYQFVATATNVGGLITTETTTVTLLAQPLRMDGGVADASDAASHGGSGCGCRAGTKSGRDGGWAIALAAVLRRRRRRRLSTGESRGFPAV